MEDNPVTIVKNGELINIDQDKLCRNDTVVLQAGDIAPADLKLIEATRLEVDEFDLTGEIMPVIKETKGNDALIYMGSRIIKGTGKGIVVATGDQTEYGKVLKQNWEQNETYKFPIIKKKYFILVFMLLPALVISLIQSHNLIFITVFYLLLLLAFLLLQNSELFSYLLIKNEIKNLERFRIQICDEMALERINQIDIICFDKTGVLTTRQMTVKNIYWIDRAAVNVDNELNKERAPYLLKIACALCHDVSFYERIDQANPIDKALISFAEKLGINIKEMLMHSKRIYDLPFNSENRYMACGYELNNKQVYYFAKGDPDVIIGMCDSYITENGAKKKVDYDFLLFNKSNIDVMNQKGGTTIALAYTSDFFNKSSKEFTFLCLLQLENSLQQGAKAIIEKISEKGIRSIMLTGDRAETAIKVGKDCGMLKDSTAHLAGRIIERMPLLEVARQAEYCSVFARLLPSQKGLIIRLLQDKGHCVVMIGDGPNDGIALKVADIGISFVKNSSSIARRLSKILIDDLDDLLRLIEGAHRIKRIAKYLKLMRIILLSASLFGIYLWALSSIKVIH